MSHPLGDYARAVQKALGADQSLEHTSYTWCLRQVQSAFEEAKAKAREKVGEHGAAKDFKAAIVEQLIAIVRPRARKAPLVTLRKRAEPLVVEDHCGECGESESECTCDEEDARA